MPKNNTNSKRIKVTRMHELKNMPTLVYYDGGGLSIQHPIVYLVLHPVLNGDYRKDSTNAGGMPVAMRGILDDV